MYNKLVNNHAWHENDTELELQMRANKYTVTGMIAFYALVIPIFAIAFAVEEYGWIGGLIAFGVVCIIVVAFWYINFPLEKKLRAERMARYHDSVPG